MAIWLPDCMLTLAHTQVASSTAQLIDPSTALHLQSFALFGEGANLRVRRPMHQRLRLAFPADGIECSFKIAGKNMNQQQNFLEEHSHFLSQEVSVRIQQITNQQGLLVGSVCEKVLGDRKLWGWVDINPQHERLNPIFVCTPRYGALLLVPAAP